MSAQTSMLHIRVDEDTKEQASAALGHMGLTVSEAVRLFLRRVVEDQAFPLDLKVPNATSRTAIAEANAIARDRKARFRSSDDLFAALEANSSK